MIPLQFGVPGGPELLIIFLIAIIIPFALAYYVYTDAKDRGNDDAALWAVVVGVATALTFVGGLVALVVYVWQRD